MITFAPITEHEHPLVVEWLHKEHVRPYFHGQGLPNEPKTICYPDIPKLLEKIV